MVSVLQSLVFLVLGVLHYSHGQTLFNCGMRTFCQDKNLTKGYINALSQDKSNYAQFDCFMTIPLDIVQINWYYQRFDGNSPDPGKLNKIYSNVPGSIFTTSVSILDLSNFTYGPVRSRLQIRNATAEHEGTYSCVEADQDVSTRQYNACLFVLGYGVYEDCPTSLTGCKNSTQAVKSGDDAELDVKVVFRGGGDCAHQTVSKLTVLKDSEVVYSCSNTEPLEHCTNEDYPKFVVKYGSNCKLDCKFYFDLVLLDYGVFDDGAYTAEVLFEAVGHIAATKLTRTFILELDRSSVGISGRSAVFFSTVIAPSLCVIILLMVALLLIIKAILLVQQRRRNRSVEIKCFGYGSLPGDEKASFEEEKSAYY